jgi:hypothetical protein
LKWIRVYLGAGYLNPTKKTNSNVEEESVLSV